MKIAVWHNLPSGGGKRVLHEQVSHLVARGHHVEAWCPPSADRSYLPLADVIEEHVVPLPRYRKLTLGKLTGVPREVGRLLREMEDHCRAAAAGIMAGDFDVLLAHPCQFFRSTPIARFVDLPSVLYQQEPYRWLYEALPRLPWLAPEPSKRPLFSPGRLREYLMDRRILHNARVQGRAELDDTAAFDRVLVNSLFSRESVKRAYGLDADVCYLGTDLSQFVDRDEPRESMVVGLGSITVEKNVEFAIRALALLDRPRPRLVWIGNIADERYLARLMQLAADLDVPFEPKVRIGDDELVATLNRASVMVYAPRLEPFGLAPIEAGACGLPVVAIAEGGIRETVRDGETGLLVQPTPRAMADGVAALLADPQRARRLGRAARVNAVTHWSSIAATDRVERVLREMTAA